MQGSKERSSALSLTLTTLVGEDIQLVIDPREHDRLHDFENAVLEQLPHLGSNSTFGCELQFAQKDTHEVLADPIRGTLRANQCFYVIARQCFVEAAHKGHLKGKPKPFEYLLARMTKFYLKRFPSTRKSAMSKWKQASGL